jgi:galacturonokinase
MREKVSQMAKVKKEHVRVVVSPYRICPLGAHIDHQVLLYMGFVIAN